MKGDNNLVQLIETQWSGGADVMERFPDGGSDKSFLQRDAESSQWEAILSVAPPGKKIYIYSLLSTILLINIGEVCSADSY